MDMKELDFDFTSLSTSRLSDERSMSEQKFKHLTIELIEKMALRDFYLNRLVTVMTEISKRHAEADLKQEAERAAWAAANQRPGTDRNPLYP